MPFNPKGDFGERHIHTLPYRLMPEYDPSNEDHEAIAALARKIADAAEAIVAGDDYLNDPSRALTVRRGRLRATLHATEEYLASDADDEAREEALIEAHTTIAATGLVPEIKEHVEAEAEKLANQWLNKYRVQIKRLSDERQEVYRQIREMSTHPLDIDLARPTMWMQPTRAREADGSEVDLPRFERHLLCDEDGQFPEVLSSSWEEKVLLAELERQETIAWYRNPSRTSQDSLGIAYEDGDEIKIVRPDFIFFARMPDGSIAADIIDPHGIQFGDALPKLKGLAAYAGSNGGSYRRVEAVAKLGDKFRVLDLTEANVRTAIEKAESINALYDSDVATDYDV